ncbi:MAG: CoA pyrophosphatase [Anaerostipes sp.]|jgi:coenzyme A diphosphatase NUDT7|nr:CoA pyrophosphatase [Anaerostipes sp.]MDD3746129.1 CoA pyrophosphatase [Anaerostipes sp.]
MFRHLQSYVPKQISEFNLKQYAVLIPLIKEEGAYHVLFQIRAKSLSSQPGEVCFPGGKVEKNETSRDAALRETCEELLISKKQIQYLGPLDYLVTPYGTRIDPFLGELTNYENTYSKDEVESIFTVPLSFFKEHKPLTFENQLQTKIKKDFPVNLVPGGSDYPWAKGKSLVHFYEYDDHIIWGLTAKLLLQNIQNIWN